VTLDSALGTQDSGLRTDLSADLGEGAPDDAAIWPLVDSANVACGGHIGDLASMAQAAVLARDLGVRLGAHPSYPDRENFGRRSLSLPPAALRASLIEQITALRDVAARHGVALVHVKPHGALYNDAHANAILAAIIVDAIGAVDGALAIVCAGASQMAAAARTAGMPVIREAFADRRYQADGSLTPRGTPGALLGVDEAAAQAAMLAQERAVIAGDGSRVSIAFDTICIHADMERAAERLRAIRSRLGGR
jgi:UPF0271 protein